MRFLKSLLSLLLLAVLPAVFLWKLTIAGRILVGLDPFNFFYPYHDAVAAALNAGLLPEWNPALFGGVPFLADSQAQLFYPLSWPFLSWSAPDALTWGIALHLAIAALGTYVWARRGLGMGRSGAWVAGAVFSLGGYLGAQVEHVNQVQAASWLPWLLLGYEWGRGMPNSQPANDEQEAVTIQARQRIFGVVLGAFALAMSLLAGHSQTTFISLIMLGLWTLRSAVRDDERTRTDVLKVQRSGASATIVQAAWRHFISVNVLPLLMIVLIGGLLAAVQLVPTQRLSTLSQRSGGLSFLETVSFSFDPRIIPRALLPTFGQDIHLLSEYVGWIGLVALMLAIIGALGEYLPWGRILARPTRASRDFGLLASGTGLFLALGIYNPLYWLLWRIVPGFNLFRAPARWLLLWAFGAAVLAGAGLERLRHANLARQKEREPSSLHERKGDAPIIVSATKKGKQAQKEESAQVINEGYERQEQRRLPQNKEEEQRVVEASKQEIIPQTQKIVKYEENDPAVSVNNNQEPTREGESSADDRDEAAIAARAEAERSQLAVFRERGTQVTVISGAVILITLLIFGAWPPLKVLPWWIGIFTLGIIVIFLRWIWREWFPISYVSVVILLLLAELWAAAWSQDYQQATAPEAYVGLRPAPAHLVTAQPEVGAARILSLSNLTWDPGDLTTLQERHADLLDEKPIYDLVVVTKLKEVLAPNQPMRWGIQTADGYGGGLLPSARWVSFQYTLPLAKVVPDGRLREQLTGRPRTALLDVMGVEWVIVDKVNDWWNENIFHDLGASITFSAGQTQSGWLIPSPEDSWDATDISFVVFGDWPVTPGTISLDGQSFSLSNAEERAARETWRGIERHMWLSIESPIRFKEMTISADAEWTLGGVTLVDNRLPGFQPLPADPTVRTAFSGDVTIYQRLDGLGRAWVVPQAIPVETIEAAATFVAEPTFDARTTVIVEHDTDKNLPTGGSGDVTWLRDNPGDIQLMVSVPEGGWLIQADAPFPGWQAIVDGQPAEWQAANVINRALYLPAGKHTVTWRYQTPGLLAGLIGTLLGVVVLIGWVVYAWWRS